MEGQGGGGVDPTAEALAREACDLEPLLRLCSGTLQGPEWCLLAERLRRHVEGAREVLEAGEWQGPDPADAARDPVAGVRA